MGIKEACACEDQHITIDIPEDLEPDLNSSCWIHRVPRKIRQLKEEAYTPQLISVGPFHYGNPQLKSMEHHKTKYQDQFWKWDFCKHIEVDDIKDFMEDGDRRESIRRSYAGTLGFGNDPDQLFHVILRDACFIFELFLRNYEISKYDKDYISKTPWLRKAVELDLIMLENQLPFFVFTERFDFILLTKPQNSKELDMNNSRPYPSQIREESEGHNFFLKITCAFFIDYYSHGKLLDEEIRYPIHDGNMSCLYTAKQLDGSGVNFVPRKDQRLADIKIEQSTHKCMPWKSLKLEVPEFKVEDDTECVMRNIMALEQCVYPFETYICNYVSFLDQLINTAEDVELLVEKKVVHNLLGSNDAVADLINKLCD
ncbi:UPF0481 protein At3g47200-like [Ziziphus jujuba]|uniref:UPF0481 protein At3g47200-like n=1 Tax=Ziziphus jujuba TaxID=326968 RepID=A0ABM4AD99_ZIZJJ|nr:UPF0481 protein At3g47200-like [Ziziphus jujuba]